MCLLQTGIFGKLVKKGVANTNRYFIPHYCSIKTGVVNTPLFVYKKLLLKFFYKNIVFTMHLTIVHDDNVVTVQVGEPRHISSWIMLLNMIL